MSKLFVLLIFFSVTVDHAHASDELNKVKLVVDDFLNPERETINKLVSTGLGLVKMASDAQPTRYFQNPLPEKTYVYVADSRSLPPAMAGILTQFRFEQMRADAFTIEMSNSAERTLFVVILWDHISFTKLPGQTIWRHSDVFSRFLVALGHELLGNVDTLTKQKLGSANPLTRSQAEQKAFEAGINFADFILSTVEVSQKTREDLKVARQREVDALNSWKKNNSCALPFSLSVNKK